MKKLILIGLHGVVSITSLIMEIKNSNSGFLAVMQV